MCNFVRLWMVACLCAGSLGVSAAETGYVFGVLNQRSPVLSASYWNPILEYIGRKAGVTLSFRMGKTVEETDGLMADGAFDFIYSNHIFLPGIPRKDWHVYARPRGEPIRGQLVMDTTAPYHSLEDLAGQTVVFPSNSAFVAYAVPLAALNEAGVKVEAAFAGNQEGAMSQLKLGRARVIGVNSEVMENYARREKLNYRVLWASPPFLNLPLAAHQRVPSKVVAAVSKAFLGMADDPVGRPLLVQAAELIRDTGPIGYVPASDPEYDDQRKVYRSATTP